MWNRQAIKERGKTNFKNNYGNSVLAAVIYNLFIIGGSTATSSQRENISEEVGDNPDAALIVMAVLAVVGVILLIWSVLSIFVFNPLEVGCQRFFVVNQHQPAQMGELKTAFKNNYGATVIGIFVRDFLICLGFIFFVIPGLILSYSYRMVPYILADDPNLSGIEALKISRAMMKGQKWNCFVFDLSFMLWYILSVVTCGIAGVFYVNPYKYNSDAALYEEIRDQYQKNTAV